MMYLFIGVILGALLYPLFLLLRTLGRDLAEMWEYLDVIEEDPSNLTFLGRWFMKTMRAIKGNKS